MIKAIQNKTPVTLNAFQGLTFAVTSQIKMLKHVQHDGFVQGAAS